MSQRARRVSPPAASPGVPPADVTSRPLISALSDSPREPYLTCTLLAALVSRRSTHRQRRARMVRRAYPHPHPHAVCTRYPVPAAHRAASWAQAG